MERFCNYNQSSHVSIPTGFVNGKNCTFIVSLNPVDWKSRNILGLVSEPLSLQQSTTSVQNVFNPCSCITVDCSCIWQSKRGSHNRHNILSLFLWLKIGQNANAPDETHHSNATVLSFFGLRVLCITLESQYAVTQVLDWTVNNCIYGVRTLVLVVNVLPNSWILKDLTNYMKKELLKYNKNSQHIEAIFRSSSETQNITCMIF